MRCYETNNNKRDYYALSNRVFTYST